MNPIGFVTSHVWGIVLGAVVYECYYRKMKGRS